MSCTRQERMDLRGTPLSEVKFEAIRAWFDGGVINEEDKCQEQGWCWVIDPNCLTHPGYRSKLKGGGGSCTCFTKRGHDH